MNSNPNYARIEKAITYLKARYRDQPSLEDISRHVGLSKYHFQRMFEQWAGVSPKVFIQFLTLEHAKKLLKQGESTLSASYDAGLSGSGRLHDLFVKMEAATPGEFKDGGGKLKIIYGFYESLFGPVFIAETDKGVCHLSFAPDKKNVLRDLKSQWHRADIVEAKGPFAKAAAGVLSSRKRPAKNILVSVRGTAFQVKVWEALLKIPEGHIVSYGRLAGMINRPKAVRAVASAVARNPVAYLIPCHRVIRESGVIGKYRWGRARKTALLGYEAARAR